MPIRWLLHHLELNVAYEAVSQQLGELALQMVSILVEPMLVPPLLLLKEAVELVHECLE